MTVKEYLQMSKEELAVELAVRDRLKLHKENQKLKSELEQLKNELYSTRLMNAIKRFY